MGGEHFGFLIEAGRNGFPEFDDDPRLWVRVIDEIIGRKFACGHDCEERVDRYCKLSELLDERAQELGLDEEMEDYEEKRDELLRPEERDIFLRGADTENYGGIKSVMGIMPYGGEWIPMSSIIFNEPWDIEGLGPQLGYNWGSAMAYAWRLQGYSDPPASRSLPKLLEELQGTWVLEALQEGFKLRPLPADLSADSGEFRLEIQEEETAGEAEHPRPLEKSCCFVPPFIAGIDRIMDGPVFSDCLAQDIRMDPLRPLDRRSAIMFLNVRW